MSEFLKKFLLEDARKFSPTGRFVALAAFGKHPGWDDHVEDLGLETESLNVAKLLLYVNGIGGQIDSGAWEKLEPAQQLPGFKHLFVWQRAGQILIGRMWSSSDGKGRKRYPMVVCLHFVGVSLAWALRLALPVMEELELDCLSTSSAEQVRATLARKRAALREAVQSGKDRGEYAPLSPEALSAILNSADDSRMEGFLRVLYQVQGQFGAFSPGLFTSRGSSNPVRVQQVRVPVAGANPEQALLFWTRFFMVFLDPSVPLLLTLPLEMDWLDVTAGEPESQELFCLRATPKAVPKVSEVPYTLDADFRAKALGFLASFRQGGTAQPDLKIQPPVSTGSPPAAGRGGWLKWLGVGTIVLASAVAAVFFLSKGGSSPFAFLTSAPQHPHSAVTNSLPAPSANPPAPGAVAAAKPPAEPGPLGQQMNDSGADAAAARLKTEAETAARDRERQLAEATAREKQVAEAAAREKERQAAEEKEKLAAEAAAKAKQQAAAEAARLEAQKQAALQRQLEEQSRQAAETLAAKTTPPVIPMAKPELVSASTPAATGPRPVPPVPAQGTAGPREMTNSIGMVLVSLPSGLWVGKYEVTQAEYTQVMNTNPSNPRWLDPRQPVQQVTWNDAVAFTRRLTDLEKTSLPPGKSYSLPTEKQWQEFSAQQKFEDLPGGTTRRSDPAPVGQSAPPNKFGLYDVLGNLWEWCLDDAPGDQKLLKGGAFNSGNYDRTLPPDTKSLTCGFRCILVSAQTH